VKDVGVESERRELEGKKRVFLFGHGSSFIIMDEGRDIRYGDISDLVHWLAVQLLCL
jgi:hypothetical protein